MDTYSLVLSDLLERRVHFPASNSTKGDLLLSGEPQENTSPAVEEPVNGLITYLGSIELDQDPLAST
jgi:hypothetical protein